MFVLLELFGGGGYLFLGKWECIEFGMGFREWSWCWGVELVLGSGVGVRKWVGGGEWRVKPLEPERKNKT